MQNDLEKELPSDLPIPEDDGAAAHLVGLQMPEITLNTTSGTKVNVATLGDVKRAVIYLYPRTGRPDVPLPDGWDLIPGARGCTPESCAFRDHAADIAAAGATVYGLSSQSTTYQQEVVERLHLPFPLISDVTFALDEALSLPTFDFEGTRLYKRLTLIISDSFVEHVFYPVFPPDRHAEEVLSWLRHNSKV